MNQKILAALSITAIILGVINLTLLFFLNPQINEYFLNTAQEIPLENINIEIQKVSGENITQYYRVRIRASIHDESRTLYDCILKMDYLTESNTWKTNSEYFGALNLHSDTSSSNVVITKSFNVDNDFNNDDENLKTSQAFLNGYQLEYEGNNIRVEAYGYPKP